MIRQENVAILHRPLGAWKELPLNFHRSRQQSKLSVYIERPPAKHRPEHYIGIDPQFVNVAGLVNWANEQLGG